MADWATVRYDPNYEEKLDPEIIPLCDALNSAGFFTTSCCGHGYSWPHVWFEHGDGKRTESLARFVLETEQGDFRPHFSIWQKEVRLDGYAWSLEIHLNNLYADTPASQGLKQAEAALAEITQAINLWAAANNSGHQRDSEVVE